MFSPRGGSTADIDVAEASSVPVRPQRAVQPKVITDVGAPDPPPGAGASRTLRVAHFTDTYEPRRDGIVTSLQTLVRAMGELGHEGLTVVPRHRDQDGVDDLLQLRSMPCGVAQFRLASWPRRRHVDRIAAWQPDIVHVHTPGPVGLLGVMAASRLGVPLVQTYHTDLHAYADAYRLPSRVLSGVVRAYARRLGVPRPAIPAHVPRSARRQVLVDNCNYLLLSDADIVLVPTPAVLARHGLPVVADRLFIAPAGVALPSIPPGSRVRFRARYGLGSDAPVVLFVGRVNREKGVDLLVEAFSHVVRQVPAARLLLVGAVYDHRWIRHLLSQAGIADQTVLTGELEPAQVARAYAASDVFGFPSQTDTQGLVLQEAALAGLPSVLVDPALHGSGPLAGSGVLAEPKPARLAAALAELLTDPVRRQSIGLAAQRRAEQNTPAQYAARMAVLYASAIDGSE